MLSVFTFVKHSIFLNLDITFVNSTNVTPFSMPILLFTFSLTFKALYTYSITSQKGAKMLIYHNINSYNFRVYFNYYNFFRTNEKYINIGFR